MLLLLALACPSPDTKDPTGTDATAPTWSRDIAPIVAAHCSGCHTDGEIAPFALDSYEAAAPMAYAMVNAIAAGTMPPWSEAPTESCTPRFGFKDDLSLTDEQKALISAWADAGAPEGDPSDAADLPDPVTLTLADLNQHVEPDVGFAASGNHDQYVCYVMEPSLTAERWLTGVQVIPGNRTVVHHALIFADDSGEAAALANSDGWYECPGSEGLSGNLVGAWAPGAVPSETPPGVAMPVAAGSKIVMQIHYHPTGEVADEDVTGIDLRWQDTAPDHEAVLALVGNAESADDGLQAGPDDENGVEFRIPANVSGHTESMSFPIEGRNKRYQVYMAGTHMHYVGTDMAIWVDHKNPEEGEPESECLVETPKWDFDWQRGYAYDTSLDTVPTLRTGDTIRMTCTYDNTLANPGVARALSDAGLTDPQDVFLGETTLDEMCLGVFGIVYN